MSNESTLTSIGQRLLRSHELPPVVMKRVPCIFFFGALLAAGMAAAAPEPPPGKQPGTRPRPDQPADAERGRQDDGRFRPAEEGDRRHHSRLSPEERRALRQHINEAGQDLYPEKKNR
jgi:hypothetical protein